MCIYTDTYCKYHTVYSSLDHSVFIFHGDTRTKSSFVFKPGNKRDSDPGMSLFARRAQMCVWCLLLAFKLCVTVTYIIWVRAQRERGAQRVGESKRGLHKYKNYDLLTCVQVCAVSVCWSRVCTVSAWCWAVSLCRGWNNVVHIFHLFCFAANRSLTLL